MSRPRKFYYNTCEICGAVFEARKADVKTCSPGCRRKLKVKEGLEKYGRVVSPARLDLRKCVVCGADYEPSSGNQLTCSTACGRILRARRRAARKLGAQPEAVAALPLHVAEGVCRRLGMSYGSAGAEALNLGLTLSQFLAIEAAAEGIDLEKEAIT